MTIETLQSLLLKKISLESKWNQLYLDNGAEIVEMKWIDLELKKVRLQMRELSAMAAKAELLQEYSDITS
jgi:hypothetical protein